MKLSLFNHRFLYVVTGPSRTGKTTFLAAYAEKHHKRFGTAPVWLTFPSIRERVRELLPDYFRIETDIMAPADIGSEISKPFAVIGDEFARMLSKYDHAGDIGKAFVNLVSIHGHKNFDMLLSDQALDLVRGFRTRVHWIVMTGINDILLNEMRNHFSARQMQWIEENQETLIQLGLENRYTIPKGFGRVILTNGVQAYTLRFEKPTWYTQDLSTVWKGVSTEELRSEVSTEETRLKYWNPDSDFIQAAYLALHFARGKYGSKITKEKFSSMFLLSSHIVMGSPAKLPDNGRGIFEDVLSTHKIFCTWCKYREKYQEAIKTLEMLDRVENTDVQELDQHAAELIG